MQNSQNANEAKNKKANVNSELKKINLGKFAEILKDKVINKTTSEIKEGIYKYYDGERPTSSQRDKFRRKIASMCDSVLLSAKAYAITPNEANEKNLKDSVKEFNKYYKFRYTLNNYSVESITSSQKDTKRADFKLLFEIIKDNNLQL